MDKRRELDWLAFQYIAGELNPSDCEAFEQRLADDQMAREAVAAAVNVAQCAAVAETELAQVAPAPIFESSAWVRNLCVVLSTAACLALFVAIHGMPGPERVFRPEKASGSSAEGLNELAIFWSESREDWDDPILESPAAAAEPIDHLADLDPVLDEMEDEGFSSDWIQQAVFTVGYLHDEEAGAGASQRGANL